MLFALVCAVYATPPSERLGDASDATPDPDASGPITEDDLDTQVVGGSPSPPGSWQSTVAVIYGNMPGCTGTLVAPDTVVTAAHCVTPEVPTHVRTGSVDATQGGQLLSVASATFHPSYDGWTGADIAVLQLQAPSNSPVTVVATDCVGQQTLYDGSPVMIVGFGSTNPAGTQYPDVLYEAASTIRDADCSQDVLGGLQTTCEPALRPAGELAAGGNGVDSCYGDSGGPLYVQGVDGDWYLAGITSRGFAAQSCGSGGVYARPDTYVGWIESVAGPLPRPICGSGPGPVDDPDEPEDPIAPPTEPDPADEDVEKVDLVVETNEMVIEKNRLGSVELTVDGAVGAVEWEVLDAGQGDRVEIEGETLLYAPPRGKTGVDRVVVQVRDGAGSQSVGEIEIRVVRRAACDHAGGVPFVGFVLSLLALGTRRRR